MISTTSALLVLSFLTPFSVRAANDWSVPCVSGGCTWDTGDGKTTAYSSMAIGGTNNLISDITPAAGWQMSGCNPDWSNGTQTVQMTCTGSSNATSLCSHVYEGGVENTIVRLPENCGTGPFARVVSATNKTSSLSSRATNGTVTGSHTFTLDYNFSKVPTSRGKVTFAVTSTNLKGQPGVSKRDLDALRGRGRAGDLHRKRFASLKRRSIGSFIGDAASAVTSAAGSAASSIGSAVSNANSIDKTLNSGKLTPVSFNKDVVLFDQSISCSSGDVSGNAELKIDVDGKVDATLSFGVTIVGTIVPPELSDFSVTADLGGSTSATFNVDATAEGTFDTKPVQLFQIGFPGLSIPSVITLGPEFTISGQVTMDLKAEAKMAIQAAWDFPSVKLVFPQEKGASSGDATVSNTNNPLQLSADTSVDVSGTVTAHIIPRIDFGIDLFGGSDKASIFIDADISASLNLDVNAQASANNTATNTTTSAASTSTSANTTSTATAANATQTDATQTDAGNSTTTASDATTTSANATSTATDSIANSTSTATDSIANATTTAGDASQTDANSTTTSTSQTATDSGANATSTDSSSSASQTSTTDTASSTTTTQTATDLGANATSTDSSSSASQTSTTESASSTTGTASSTTGTASSTTDTASSATDTSSSITDTTVSSTTDTASSAADTAISTTAAASTSTTDITSTDASTTDLASTTAATDSAATDTATDDTASATTTDDTQVTATDDGTATDTAALSDPTATDGGADVTDTATADDPTATDDPAADPAATDGSVTDNGDGSDTTDPTADTPPPPPPEDTPPSPPPVDDPPPPADDPPPDDSGDDTGDDGGDFGGEDGGDFGGDDGGDFGGDDGGDFRKRYLREVHRRATSDSSNGCITLSGAIAINGGLQGSLAPFFDKQESFPIFSKNVQLFQKCLNGQPTGGDTGAAAERKRRRQSRPLRRAGDTSGLTCPTGGISSALKSLI